MKVKAKIKFRTMNPISQETGLKMWAKGSHFCAVPSVGGRTYQLTSAGESDTVEDAREVLHLTITEIVEQDGNSSNTVIEFVESKIVKA